MIKMRRLLGIFIMATILIYLTTSVGTAYKHDLIIDHEKDHIKIHPLIGDGNYIKIGEIKINGQQVIARGEGIKVYTTDVRIKLPDWFPAWLAGKEIEIKNVTWREKLERIDSSFSVYVDYQANAPKYLMLDLAVVLIYDLNLNLSLQDIIEMLNGNYSPIVEQLKNPALAKYTFNQIKGRWTNPIDMRDEKIFRDTYVIVGLYIDLLDRKVYSDAEIVTFQAVKMEKSKEQQTDVIEPRITKPILKLPSKLPIFPSKLKLGSLLRLLHLPS